MKILKKIANKLIDMECDNYLIPDEKRSWAMWHLIIRSIVVIIASVIASYVTTILYLSYFN